MTTISILFVRLFLSASQKHYHINTASIEPTWCINILPMDTIKCSKKTLKVQQKSFVQRNDDFPADLKIDMSNAWNNQLVDRRNYHWQDNLSANMLYFIKSFFDRNVCYYFVILSHATELSASREEEKKERTPQFIRVSLLLCSLTRSLDTQPLRCAWLFY